jgi:hypothetical protein
MHAERIPNSLQNLDWIMLHRVVDEIDSKYCTRCCIVGYVYISGINEKARCGVRWNSQSRPCAKLGGLRTSQETEFAPNAENFLQRFFS